VGFSGERGNVDGDASAATFDFPIRLAVDGLGQLFVATGFGQEAPSSLIRRVDLETLEVSTFAGAGGERGFTPGPLPTTIGCAASMTLDQAGDLVFADFCDGAVGVIRPL